MWIVCKINFTTGKWPIPDKTSFISNKHVCKQSGKVDSVDVLYVYHFLCWSVSGGPVF